ncbi:MAG: hypothetical protein KBT11_05705 [Treponema sp.]|nr:hypothetical protein [Candidatus Treponema equifaecale]
MENKMAVVEPVETSSRTGDINMENKITLSKQIIIGLAFAAMEFLMVVLNYKFLKLPLYFDCIWTCAASFFSPLSGIICAVCYHFPVIILLHHDWPSLIFSLCSLTVVLCVRIFVRYKKNLPFVLSFIMLIFVIAFAISIEGGIIYNINYEHLAYIEESPDNNFIYSFFIRGFSFLFSGILGRIPVNLIDKTVACIFGLLIYKTAGKISKI